MKDNETAANGRCWTITYLIKATFRQTSVSVMSKTAEVDMFQKPGKWPIDVTF